MEVSWSDGSAQCADLLVEAAVIVGVIDGQVDQMHAAFGIGALQGRQELVGAGWAVAVRTLSK
jgi:hypothetical protein